MAFKSSFASTALTATALTSTALPRTRNKMNLWRLKEEKEGTRGEADSPLCGRALVEQEMKNNGARRCQLCLEASLDKGGRSFTCCVLRHHAKLKIQRCFWSLEIQVE